MARKFRLIALALAGLAWLYGLAGMAGGLVPANRGWHPPARGVRIYVEDNGIHTGIVLPAAGWDNLVRPGHLRDPRYARHGWRSFGWGDRDFYIGTPTWRDIDPLTIARGALGIGGGGSVMHVEALAEPRAGRSVRAITLRPAEYARLAAFIRASFVDGAPVPGYGDHDAFYPAKGRYSAVVTCNAWTGAALRHAGIRMGAWTPFPVTVMGWLQ